MGKGSMGSTAVGVVLAVPGDHAAHPASSQGAGILCRRGATTVAVGRPPLGQGLVGGL